MMIASFLYVIPLAVSQSLFAEGSHNSEEISNLIKRATKISSGLLIPAIIIIVFLGKYLLQVFGKGYSTQGLFLLQIFSISSILISINYIASTIYNFKHKIFILNFMYLLNAISITLFSYFFLRYGLVGIGIAWFIGNLLTALFNLSYIYLNRRFILLN